jgi:hypothetical protein
LLSGFGHAHSDTFALDTWLISSTSATSQHECSTHFHRQFAFQSCACAASSNPMHQRESTKLQVPIAWQADAQRAR